MIMGYLTNRKIYTEINTNVSKTIKSKNIGVCQGSTLSGLLYLIYTLDITATNHIKNHKNNLSEKQCTRAKSAAYVDDVYGVVVAEEEQIWNSAKNYINSLNNYFKNNKLINNIKKTKIMIISKNKKIQNKIINIEGKEIGHSSSIKILGTIFNDTIFIC